MKIQKNKGGAAVGVIIIIIILIIAGIYFWRTGSQQDGGATLDTEVDTVTDSLGTVSDSDELDAIEGDLNLTDLEDLDLGLEGIDEDLGI